MKKQDSIRYKFRPKTLVMEKTKTSSPDVETKIVDQYGFQHRMGNADSPGGLRAEILNDLKQEPISPTRKKSAFNRSLLAMTEEDRQAVTKLMKGEDAKQTVHEYAVENRDTFATTNFLKHLGHRMNFK